MSRIMGYVELLGRLFAVVNGRETTRYVTPESSGLCWYFLGGAPSCLHGHVFAGLGHDEDSLGEDNGETAADAFPALGYDLTARAETLAMVSQEQQDDGLAWGHCVARGVDSALAVDASDADRMVGELTVVTTIAHLTHRGEPPAHMNASSDPAGTTAPCPDRQDEHASLWGRVLQLWGITDQWAPRDGDVVEVLTRAGWGLSPRARSLIVAARDADGAGLPWGEIARLLPALAVEVQLPAEGVDR